MTLTRNFGPQFQVELWRLMSAIRKQIDVYEAAFKDDRDDPERYRVPPLIDRHVLEGHETLLRDLETFLQSIMP